MSESAPVGRVRWSAIGAAVAVTLGAGGLMTASATISSGEKPVTISITPCRIMDTRPGADAVGPRGGAIGAGETVTFSVRGAVGNCNLPADAIGVVMNLAAIGGTANSFLTVFPGGTTRPLAANLNWNAGDPPKSNAATVRTSDTGAISFFNLAGTVHVAADVVAYLVDHTHDDRYYTESEIDGRFLRASATETGVMLSGGASSGVTVRKVDGPPAGNYVVDFNRNILNCSWVASITNYLAGTLTRGGPGLIDVAGIPSATFDELSVRTWTVNNVNFDTDPTDLPFTVLVMC
jgi:hypothetical protein